MRCNCSNLTTNRYRIDYVYVVGSPFRCDVLEIPNNKKTITAVAYGEGLKQVVLGRSSYFEVNPHVLDYGSIDAQIFGTYKISIYLVFFIIYIYRVCVFI